MAALRFTLKWLGIAVASAFGLLVALVILMLLGFAPAAEALFGIAYCLDGYGPCGSKT